MSLLMQALRKAERARAHHGDEHEAEHQFGQDAVASPPPMEGGPAFAVMPEAWRLEPLDAEPPVIAAQEAAHDPVPPQARHEPMRAAAQPPAPTRSPASQPAQGTMPSPSATIAPDSSPRPSAAPGAWAGADRRPAPDPVVRGAAATPSPPPRALASSQRRLMILAGTLAALLAVFALIYWRAVYGPGPGARLPMVPMPGPGAAAMAQAGSAQDTAIAVTPYLSDPGSDPAGQNATAAPDVSAAPSPTATPAPATTPGATSAPSPPPAQMPLPSQPRTSVTIPTPAQLAAIPDPAIRAEAMRDAAERAARQVQLEGTQSVPGAAAATAPPVEAPPPPDAVRPPKNSRPRDSASHATAAPPTSAGKPSLKTAVGENGDVRFMRSAATVQVAPALQHGYAALQAGDLTSARQQYDLALLQDPNSRDALLGSAAVAQRQNDGKQASANYLRLLELDPNDPEALAALAGLRPGDQQANEIKLRGLARQHPESGPVQFALGNLYARQGRWAEAQQSYFRAFTAMPDNADYAFNLGVGLDRMNQPRLAQTYYRRALELAQASPPGFNTDAVRQRLQVLETPPH